MTTITRQRRKSQGLCIDCDHPSVDQWRCQHHKEVNSRRQFVIQRIKRGIPLDAPLYTKATR